MAIAASDIKLRLSGGSGNSDTNASLGGVKSSTEVVDATLHNLFDLVSGAEMAAGDIEYRCIYIHNGHGSLTAEGCAVYIDANTPSTDTVAAIGLGTAAVNATEQTVANESTAPSGVSFTETVGSGAALSIGNIPFGQHKALWIRRTVTAGGSAYSNDSLGITITFDTAP